MENYSPVLVTNPTSRVKFKHVSRHEPPLITILVIETSTSSQKNIVKHAAKGVNMCKKLCKICLLLKFT